MYSTAFVVLLGIGTVFAGLILIIILCKLMSLFVSFTENAQSSPAPVTSNVVSSQPATIPDKQPLIAAISAVVAEDLGTDISNIRIHSIKRV